MKDEAIKKQTVTKIFKDDNEKLKQLSREIAVIQREHVGNPETLRRILNHPNLPTVLKSDAELKKRFGK